MPDRRGFFRELLREAASAANEIQSVLHSAAEPERAPDEWRPPPPRAAEPSERPLGDGELEAIAREGGLDARLDDIRRISLAGLRLTHAEHKASRSRLGGSPDVPPGFEWPTRNGRDLAFLGQIAIAEAAAVAETALPASGLLLFFADLDRLPSGLEPADAGSCRVFLVDGQDLRPDLSRSPVVRPAPLRISPEVVVPSAWSFPVEEVELSAEEMDAWDDVRRRVAEAQGVTLEEEIPDTLALHRLLGHADEIGRELEVDCQLASSGLDAADVSVYFEARADHEQEARTWRLLLQVSADPVLGPSVNGRLARLFVCMRESDLRRGDFSQTWMVVR